MILEYTLFYLFSHCSEASVIWILPEFLGEIHCIRSLSYIKNMPGNYLEYQELPLLL
jgi:hypothetical protein